LTLKPIILAIVFVVVGLASAAQAAAQPLSPERQGTDPRLLRPNLMEVAPGRRLHLACVGSGSPTIVFEQGGEGWIVNWRKIQAQAAGLSRTCFYDRAGFGLSDPPKDAVTGINVTDDLQRLLRAAGVHDPIVLVGHSIGGFYATLFADRFPQQVAGLVLIEPGFDGQFAPSSARQRRREQRAMREGGDRLRACADFARRNGLSRDQTHGCFGLPPDLTPDEASYVVQMFTRPYWYEAETNQSDNYFPTGEELDSPSWRQERLARREFGDLPLVVLTAETAPREGVQSDKAYAESTQRWKEGHQRLARRSTRGEWVQVDNSGHFIQLDQPEAVLGAIRRVLDEVRGRAAR